MHIKNLIFEMKQAAPVIFNVCEILISLCRKDLESFAALVKRMAQRLQVFGREMAETELPNNLLKSGNLLNAHTSRKDSLKVFI